MLHIQPAQHIFYEKHKIAFDGQSKIHYAFYICMYEFQCVYTVRCIQKSPMNLQFLQIYRAHYFPFSHTPKTEKRRDNKYRTQITLAAFYCVLDTNPSYIRYLSKIYTMHFPVFARKDY